MTRIAVVQKERCSPVKCADLCMKLCPVNRTGKECITKDEEGKAAIDESLCTGCGICTNRCPFEAISIINLPEELKKSPIHRYGQNGFHLFNLPVPKFGTVTGLVGRNGIGKSTALKILSGMLTPNLGEDDREATSKDLIEYFKGTEAQAFFEKRAKGDITISYKPQQVDLIPRMQKGTVRELLSKVDDKGTLDQAAELLSLTPILESDIKNISGGELQRVAIAAASLRKADVYFFDEPTSFLDIQQRIAVSKYIRELADDETAVMVVEHDLIILDYMTDVVNLLYGQSGAYGIVSQPKATKGGINAYLTGYLREENIRFRDKAITFMEKQHPDLSQKQSLIAWEGLRKKAGTFELDAEKGELKGHEVVGVLGPNGIGKTTFVKVLAEVENSDSGTIEGDVTVSYKPQYLETPSEELVMSILNDAIQNHDTTLIGPLELRPLLQKQLNELSGGELQRVAIALCLSRDANVFLLDEPSAYLDVEQRLNASRVISDFIYLTGKSAIIVDHDLLFIDYISNSLIVFDGIPAKEGHARGPYEMEKGMNHFLDGLDITLRRDQENRRPRVNKKDSQMDQKQKREGKLYYS